ncbi:MAG: hypothetical protein AB1451_13340 [Nitrospirota bacterium]
MKAHHRLGGSLLIGLLPFIGVADAEARGFKVYGYATPSQGDVELVYWFDHVLQSSASYEFAGRPPTTVDKEGLSRHSVELEYGVTDRWTIAAYADFEDAPNESFEYVQFRTVVSRYRLFEAGERLWDTALYFEYYMPNTAYDQPEKLETRLIFEKTFAPVNVRINPIFEKTFSTADVEEGVEFEYAAGVYTPMGPVRLGLEFYGSLGQFSDWKPWDAQTHYLFPAAKFPLGPTDVDFGVGVGLTQASDDLLVKTIVAYEF